MKETLLSPDRRNETTRRIGAVGNAGRRVRRYYTTRENQAHEDTDSSTMGSRQGWSAVSVYLVTMKGIAAFYVVAHTPKDACAVVKSKYPGERYEARQVLL